MLGAANRKEAYFHNKEKSTNSPNDSTSSKKNPKGLVRAGQGKNGKRRGGKDANKAKQELKRIKTYLTKNEVLAAEDITMIAKGEDPDKDESKKRSRQVSCNAIRVVIKNSRVLEQVGASRLAESASQATIINEELVDLC